MIINMRERATEAEVQHVIDRVKEAGYQAHVTRGEETHHRRCGRQWRTPA